MNLQEQIKNDVFQAMRDKETVKKGVLQLVKARMENMAIANKAPLTDEEMVSAVQSELKQIKASILEAQRVNRPDVVELEMKKVDMLSVYMPKQMSEEEVLAFLQEKGASKGDNVGKLIGMAMKELKGKVDIAVVREVVMTKFK